MININQPYLIIPKLIEQKTWGGSYIAKTKELSEKYSSFLIGQSYELYSGTKLSLSHNSASVDFLPELGSAMNDEVITDNILFYRGSHHITLDQLIKENPEMVLGQTIWNQKKCMPLLIKFTQSLGNSFQIHIKPGTADQHWKPKPESWYYFEDGLITCGIKKGIDLDKYKAVCKDIESYMNDISQKVTTGSMPLDKAREHARQYIHEKDPWQFVHVYTIEKDATVDLSCGGIHHSWEEDLEKAPLGNVLYEVQIDVMDPVSTIRCFDQGKLKDDGTVRPLQIDEYFKFVDTDESTNDINALKSHKKGRTLLQTPYYSLDEFVVESGNALRENIHDSFEHLFVRSGSIKVSSNNYDVIAGSGCSVFVPFAATEYTVSAISSARVLKTYITTN